MIGRCRGRASCVECAEIAQVEWGRGEGKELSRGCGDEGRLLLVGKTRLRKFECGTKRSRTFNS